MSNRWLAALRHLFVAPEPENSRIAAAETAQDRREGRLYSGHGLPAAQVVGTLDGYHTVGCLMRDEIKRHHFDCPCECHR